jgi:hypothetical protein
MASSNMICLAFLFVGVFCLVTSRHLILHSHTFVSNSTRAAEIVLLAAHHLVQQFETTIVPWFMRTWPGGNPASSGTMKFQSGYPSEATTLTRKML